MLINDLEGGDGEASSGYIATPANADYRVWEYIFEDLPVEDQDGNEYEYTIRDLSAAGSDRATPSGTASASDASGKAGDAKRRLATGSSARKQDGAVFLTDLEGTEVLDTDPAEFPAEGARVVYVPYTDIEGTYAFLPGSSHEADPEQVTLDVNCGREADEEFLGAAEAELDPERGVWSLNHVLRYNPLTCAEIDYRVEAVSGYEDFSVRYENRGSYAGAEDYAHAGGTIYHESIAQEQPVTYSVTGAVSWNDRDDLWGLRPDPQISCGSTMKTETT